MRSLPIIAAALSLFACAHRLKLAPESCGHGRAPDPDEEQILAVVLDEQARLNAVTVEGLADLEVTARDPQLSSRDPRPICLREVPASRLELAARRVELELSPIQFSTDGARAVISLRFTCQPPGGARSEGVSTVWLMRANGAWAIDTATVQGHCP